MPIIPAPAFSPNNNNNSSSSNNNNSNNNNNNIDRLRHNLSTDQIFTANDNHNTSMPNGLMQPPNQPPAVPLSKSGWRPSNPDEDEEAIPNDSLYGHQDPKKNGSLSWRDKQFGSRPSLNGMAHWSSHGYLAKASDGTMPATTDADATGYVVLKRQGEQIVTMRQPQSLPNQVPLPTPVQAQDGDRKYFSVKGFTDMNSKHSEETESSAKYLSVDARYNSMKNLPPDIRMKLRENLRQVHEKQQLQQQQHQQQQQQQQRNFTPYQAPPPPPSYPFPPAPPPRPAGMKPAPPPRQESAAVLAQPAQPAITKSSSNLEASKQMSNSVSWLEWTQQLQAYIAWVNSQLRKRADLRPVTDLRTDLQSGEVLAQLIEIICKSTKLLDIYFKAKIST